MPIRLAAHDGDWIKGDRVRRGDDGGLYVRNLAAPSGTRRVDPAMPTTSGFWRCSWRPGTAA